MSIAYGVWQIAMTQLTAGRSSSWRDTLAVGPTAKFTPSNNFLSYSPQSFLKQRLTVPHTDHFLPPAAPAVQETCLPVNYSQQIDWTC